MTWNDIARKLTSRKFWVAVAAFVTGVLAATGKISTEGAEQLTGLIMAGAACIAYIIGEGLVDAKDG